MENDPLFYALASLARDQFPNDVDELDDMARVFLVLCRGVKAYAAVWEAQDLQDCNPQCGGAGGRAGSR